MPTKPQPAPDFIPAEESPDFIPEGASVSPMGEVKTAPQKPIPTMHAQGPESAGDWFAEAGDDLRHGGGRTVVGRVLGHMQGRGDQGYSGLESGASPATADFMGSVPLGVTKAFQGATEENPVKGLLHEAEGVAQASEIPSAFMGGPALDTAIEAIPSRSHASSVFSDIEREAKDVPVNMENTDPALHNFKGSVRTGGKNSPVMQQLGRRISPPTPKGTILSRMENDLNGIDVTPQVEPIKFPEARRFYSNVSRETRAPGFLRKAIESPREPAFRYNAGPVRSALDKDLTAAADTIGRGADYSGAMKEYADAMKLRKFTRAAALVGAGEAARRTGVFGKMIHAASTQ